MRKKYSSAAGCEGREGVAVGESELVAGVDADILIKTREELNEVWESHKGVVVAQEDPLGLLLLLEHGEQSSYEAVHGRVDGWFRQHEGLYCHENRRLSACRSHRNGCENTYLMSLASQ